MSTSLDIVRTNENLVFFKCQQEVADLGLETVTLPNLDGEKVMVVPLGLPTRGVLSEKRFSYILEVAGRVWRHGVESIQDHVFQDGWKG